MKIDNDKDVGFGIWADVDISKKPFEHLAISIHEFGDAVNRIMTREFNTRFGVFVEITKSIKVKYVDNTWRSASPLLGTGWLEQFSKWIRAEMGSIDE